MRFGFRKRGIEMFVVLAVMVLAGAAHAQSTTTTETKSFEILSVDGNVLVIREASGTRELIVPSDFRFNVDGKSLAVTDLKAGMKGTATVTKTTISHPVYVTDVKNVTVVKTMGGSVIVQDADGDFKMYSQGDIDQRGINVILDGKPVKFEDLQVGDRLTASIVTEGPPQKMSKTEVDVDAGEGGRGRAAPAKVATTTTTTSQTDYGRDRRGHHRRARHRADRPRHERRAAGRGARRTTRCGSGSDSSPSSSSSCS